MLASMSTASAVPTPFSLTKRICEVAKAPSATAKRSAAAVTIRPVRSSPIATLSDSEAVALGLERSGRIVTAAALLFSIAIGAFATSEVIFVKELGLGTAIAVLIDATIIRALLVPSLMELLGKWNWWAPAPLRRLHERFGISEHPAPAPQPEPEGV